MIDAMTSVNSSSSASTWKHTCTCIYMYKVHCVYNLDMMGSFLGKHIMCVYIAYEHVPKGSHGDTSGHAHVCKRTIIKIITQSICIRKQPFPASHKSSQ